MAAHMLAQAPSLQLQKYNFGLLARQAPSGRRRLRYMALAHLNEGKRRRGSACLARHAVDEMVCRRGRGPAGGHTPLLEHADACSSPGRSPPTKHCSSYSTAAAVAVYAEIGAAERLSKYAK